MDGIKNKKDQTNSWSKYNSNRGERKDERTKRAYSREKENENEKEEAKEKLWKRGGDQHRSWHGQVPDSESYLGIMRYQVWQVALILSESVYNFEYLNP